MILLNTVCGLCHCCEKYILNAFILNNAKLNAIYKLSLPEVIAEYIVQFMTLFITVNFE